jgi:phospholipase C
MNPRSIQSHSRIAFLAAIAFLALIFPRSSRADGDLSKVKHVIIIMQENHSFDNYFGVLALAPEPLITSPSATGTAIATTTQPAARKMTTTASMDSAATSTSPATSSAPTATKMKTASSSPSFTTRAAASAPTSTTAGSPPIAKPTSITRTTPSRTSSPTASSASTT